MKRQKNTAQMKEKKNRNTEIQINEKEIGKKNQNSDSKDYKKP